MRTATLPGRWVNAIDAIAVVVSVAMALAVNDVPVPGRPAVALVFVLAVPGWAIVRLARVTLDSLGMLVAVVLSISIAVLMSLAMVAFGWVWQWATVVLAGICVLTVAAARWARLPRRRISPA